MTLSLCSHLLTHSTSRVFFISFYQLYRTLAIWSPRRSKIPKLLRLFAVLEAPRIPKVPAVTQMLRYSRHAIEGGDQEGDKR